MDGVRIAAGWVRELQGRWLGSIGVDWRSADGLQSPHRAPMALCGSCDARDGERIRSRELSRTGVARVCGEVGSVAGWQSGGEWNGSQSGHGASELGFPRPMLGKMQGKAARRAGDPSHQSEEPPPEGFGGRDPFTQADAGCPAGQVVRHHLYRQPGAVGGEAPRGHVVQPDAVLEVAYRILDLGVAAMISLQFQHLPIPVGDEAVIAVGGEEGELGTGRGLHPPDDEPHRRGVGFTLEGGRCRVRRRAERVIRPIQSEEPPPEGFGVAIRSPRPMRAVQRARLCDHRTPISRQTAPLSVGIEAIALSVSQ